MPQQPTDREQSLMIQLGFKTREDMVDWLNQPEDPVALQRIRPVYPDDEPELGADDPPYEE